MVRRGAGDDCLEFLLKIESPRRGAKAWRERPVDLVRLERIAVERQDPAVGSRSAARLPRSAQTQQPAQQRPRRRGTDASYIGIASHIAAEDFIAAAAREHHLAVGSHSL